MLDDFPDYAVDANVPGIWVYVLRAGFFSASDQNFLAEAASVPVMRALCMAVIT
jgi:hypothetical protein